MGKVMSSIWLDMKQLRGILFNSFHIQFRQYKSNIACIFIPVICMLYVEILQRMYDYTVDKLDLNAQLTHHVQADFQPVDLFMSQWVSGMHFNLSFPNEIYFDTEVDLAVTRIGQISTDSIPWRKPDGDYGYKTTPLYLRMNNTEDIDDHLFKVLTAFQVNKTYPSLGAFHIEAWNESKVSGRLEYSIQYDFQPATWKNQLYGFINDVSKFCEEIQVGMNTRYCQAVMSVSMMNHLNDKFLWNTVKQHVHTQVEQMPYHVKKYKIDVNLKEFFASMLFPLGLSILIPIFAYKLIREKSEKYREMMKLMGMKQRNYVISNIIFMFITYFVSASIFWAFGWVFKYRLITQTNVGITIVVYLGSGLTVIAMSHFIASFVTSTVLGSIVGFFYVLIVPIIGFVLETRAMTDGLWAWKSILWIETLPIPDCIYRMAEKCDATHCLTEFSQIYTDVDLFIGVCTLYGFAVIYFLVALYLDYVIVGAWGRKQSPFFFLNFVVKVIKKILGVKRKMYLPKEIPNEDPDVTELRQRIMTGEINETTQGILLKGLVKVFGKDHYAVNGVCFNVGENEIFGLLGPNGAGKTTAIRCLVGLYSQTDGEAYVNGYSISDEMGSIRSSLGYCPQFNILFDDLTPTEHLLFYSRIKGVPILKERKHVRKILKSIGLVDDTDDPWYIELWRYLRNTEKKVRQMSEGLRRQLAIACALTGDPKVVVLDEPTTGLDTSSQRKIWDIILDQKLSKSILITTHSMEEADVLSDRIGIMSRGNLVCCGNSVRLKSRFGSGYIVQINSCDMEKSEGFLLKQFGGNYRLKKIKEFGDSVSYQISPSVDGKSVRVSELFREIHKQKDEQGIIDFQIMQATLEDVFLTVIEKAEELEILEELKKSKIDKNGEGEEITVEEEQQQEEDPNFLTPKKQIIKLQGASEKTPFVEMNTPSTLPNPEYGSTINVAETDVRPTKKKKKCAMCCCCGDYCFTLFWHTWFLFQKNMCLSIRGWKLSLVILFSPVISMICVFVLAKVSNQQDFVYHPEPVPMELLHSCQTWGGKDYCYVFAYSTNGFPEFDNVMHEINHNEGFVEGDHYLKFDNCTLLTNWILAHENYTQMAICFDDFNSHTNTSKYTLLFNGTAPDFYEGDIPNQVEVWKTLVDNTIYKIHHKKNDGDLEGFEDVDGIIADYRPFPKLASKINGQQMIWSIVGPQFFTLSELLLLIITMHKLVWEKEKSVKIGLEVIGMNKLAYYLSWFLLLSIYSAGMSVVAILSGMAFVIYPFIYGNQLILFAVFYLFGLSLIAVGFFLSCFINNAKIAIIFGFIVFSICCIVDEFVGCGTIVTVFMDKKSPVWTYLLFELLYPTWNFAFILTNVIQKTSLVYDPITSTWEKPPGYGFKDLFVPNTLDFDFGLHFVNQASYVSFLFLLENTIFYMVLFAFAEYLVSYWTKGASIRHAIYKLFTTGRKVPVLEHKTDKDLLEEYDKVHDKNFPYLLKVQHIKKYFHEILGTTTKAVREVNFGINKKSCMALLGDNGAGKSTTINLIAGIYGLTDGLVTLDGKRVSMSDLGVCHQTDILYDDLTAKEHCKLFAEIRGIPNVKEEIEYRLKQVSLFKVRNERAGTFSGGMKRRLSVALACIGEPRLILLDEPTTGLDPYSRRKVWELISEMKLDKTVLFTTHSMEESEALHDRITIMTNGVLQCIGNSLQLKKKYGSCYVVKLNVNDPKLCTEVIQKYFGDIDIQDQVLLDNRVFRIRVFPKQFDQLPHFLETLENEVAKDNGYCEEFACSPTSLEDVYAQVVSGGGVEHEDKEEVQERIVSEVDEKAPLLD